MGILDVAPFFSTFKIIDYGPPIGVPIAFARLLWANYFQILRQVETFAFGIRIFSVFIVPIGQVERHAQLALYGVKEGVDDPLDNRLRHLEAKLLRSIYPW